MKNQIIILILSSFFLKSKIVAAQQAALSTDYKSEVINKLSNLLNDTYIYEDVAKKTGEHLKQQLKDGHFDQFEDNEAFANALTESVQSINKDKHMRIRAKKAFVAPPNTIERKSEERMGQINRYRSFNHGFAELKILEGNVAYLDLRGFAGMERAKEIADAYMKLLSQADAVIIDLSQNGGGSPNMVQYLCSYFFDEVLHLNSLYYRVGDRTEEYWTLDEVGGKKMGDIPLFVITGEKTFSGAEEFSYNMQTQKRATLIGQTTGGGANPGGTVGINNDLSVFIPTGRAINPITKTSWEGTGVVPEVKTNIEDSFDKAYSLAKQSAEEYRSNKKDNYESLYREMQEVLDAFVLGQSEHALKDKISQFVDARLFGEWDINALGYDYLLQKEKPETALCVFEINTQLFPESPNVFDSYGEALMNTGDLESSIKNYQMAVDLATKNEDRDLDFYKNNLQIVKQKLELKK